MVRMIPVAALALFLLGVAPSAHAGTPGVEAREHRQALRIKQGVHSGELTRVETRRLRHGQRVVDAKQAWARADGVVTTAERIVITREQNRQSHRIARQKHDGQRR